MRFVISVANNVARNCEQLSEFVHPNAHGAIYYFMQPGADSIVQFGTPTDERTQTIGSFSRALRSSV
jgi:hypothetical protein